MNNNLNGRTKIVFRNLKTTKQNTYFINGEYYLKCYQDSIKDRILKILAGAEIINTMLKVKWIIEKTKKDKVISVYNELGYLQKAGIIELKNGMITLKRKVKGVEK